MKPIKIIIVEDKREFSDALKRALEEQKRFPCEVVVLNPDRPNPPTFEEFHDEIMEHADGLGSIVLMDNQLGKWKWKGAHLAPSFLNLVAISTDEIRGTQFSFTDKHRIAYFNRQESKDALVETVLKALDMFMPPDFRKKLAQHKWQ